MPPVFDRKLQNIRLSGLFSKTGGSFYAKNFLIPFLILPRFQRTFF